MDRNDIDQSHVLEEADFADPHDGWRCTECHLGTCCNCDRGEGFDDGDLALPCRGIPYWDWGPKPEPGTVAWLIAELRKMPQDVPVTRYCDQIVTEVELRDTARDEGPNSEVGNRPHVALS